MKKVYFLFFAVALLLLSCRDSSEYAYTLQPCKVLTVKFYNVGQRYALQIDPEWVATTECGHRITSRTYIEVGDTIWIRRAKRINK